MSRYERPLEALEWEQNLDEVFTNQPYESIEPNTFSAWLGIPQDVECVAVRGRRRAATDLLTGVHWDVGDAIVTIQHEGEISEDRLVFVDKTDKRITSRYAIFRDLKKIIVDEDEAPALPIDIEAEITVGLKVLSLGNA